MFLALAATAPRTSLSPPCRARPRAFFGELFKPQSSPADVYQPDPGVLPGLPADYESMYRAAALGVRSAVDDGVAVVEVDFPPLASVNALNDGSAKSERLVHEANARAAAALRAALGGMRVVCVGCSGGARSALRDKCGAAQGLRDAMPADAIAICVQPTSEEQWAAVADLGARGVVVLNGLLNNGWYPHAFYYKPMSAFSTVTGGVVRRYPGPYTCYAVDGQKVDLEVGLTTQGRRALPDTKTAQMTLQNMYGR